MARDALVTAIDEALDALLFARVEADPIVTRAVPVMALDAALSTSKRHRVAKARTARALGALVQAVSHEGRQLVLELESALRLECGVVADMAFSVGLVATPARPKSPVDDLPNDP